MTSIFRLKYKHFFLFSVHVQWLNILKSFYASEMEVSNIGRINDSFVIFAENNFFWAWQNIRNINSKKTTSKLWPFWFLNEPGEGKTRFLSLFEYEASSEVFFLCLNNSCTYSLGHLFFMGL